MFSHNMWRFASVYYVSMRRTGIKNASGGKLPRRRGESKKERDIRPRYCTAPSRVFSNK